MSSAPLVLGLDPGSRATGYGLVEQKGNRLILVDQGVIRPPHDGDMAQRLAGIFDGVTRVIAQHGPQEASLEGVFTAKNARSALMLGQARGVAFLACARAGLPVAEYAPAAVKKALVGNGRAAKEQVRHMVGAILSCRTSLPLDASDALALAICHIHSRGLSQRLTPSGGRGAPMAKRGKF